MMQVITQQHIELRSSSFQPHWRLKTQEKCQQLSIELVFGLSILGYCRNMGVRHGEHRLGPASSVEIKGSF